MILMFRKLRTTVFCLVEDFTDILPRNKATHYLTSWFATLAIMSDKELFEAIMETRRNPSTTRPYEEIAQELGL